MDKASIIEASQIDAIATAAGIIIRGGVVAFPTETVYGLGADVCNAIAVARIFELKRRPAFDPLIVHIADPEEAERYGDFSHPLAHILMEKFWPGPLTLVVAKTDVIPPIVTAGLETVGIRMPAHPVANALIRAAGCALAAPSANPFGYVSPTEASHVALGLPAVDLILDGGRCPVGVESTILALTDSRPRILRHGGIAAEEIEAVVGTIERENPRLRLPNAPGQLTKHYATFTHLDILGAESDTEMPIPGERVGLLSLCAPENQGRYAAIEVLSPSGDLREAAANLFAALRRLDGLNLDRLIAHPVPERDLGIAIMDRLRRCAARTESPFHEPIRR